MVKREELKRHDLRNLIEKTKQEKSKFSEAALSKRKRENVNDMQVPSKKKREDLMIYQVPNIVKRNPTEEKGKGERPLEEDEDDVELESRSFHQLIQERRSKIWIKGRLNLRYQSSSLNLRYQLLCPCFKKWLRDIGQCMAHRLATDVGLTFPCSSEHIVIMDGQIHLPYPSKTRANNIKDVSRVVLEYNYMCLEVFGVDKLVLRADKEHLLFCLEQILLMKCEPMERLSLFSTLMSHYTYGSSYYKLTFVEHSVRYLMKTDDKLVGYKKSRPQKYDIYKAISGNPVLVEVYLHRSKNAEAEAEATEELWKRYENSSVGVLFFMTNFIKHADEQCERLGYDHFDDDQKVVLLEYCFPGEMHYVFYYFWSRGLKVDRNDHLHICSC